MRYTDTEKLTTEIVREYYKGSMGMFYSCPHPNVVMLSVGTGQLLESRAAIMDRLKNGNASGIHYEMEDITCKAYQMENSICFSILDSVILVCYPTGKLERVNQRVSVVWKYIRRRVAEKEGVEKEGWYAMHIHVSLGRKMQDAPINDAHLSENALKEMLQSKEEEEKFALRDVSGSVHYLTRSQMIRFETANRQVIAYTADGQRIVMNRRLTNLHETLGNKFVRIHRKHLVNAKYIQQTKNRMAKLVDGSLLPISREYYSNIRKAIEEAVK